MFDTFETDTAGYEALLEHYSKLLHPNNFQVTSCFMLFIRLKSAYIGLYKTQIDTPEQRGNETKAVDLWKRQKSVLKV